MTFHRRTADVAKGKWRGILMSFGLPENCLKDKHGPCPLCGGNDRFRWDNKEGKGTYICGQCGAGDGINLAMAYTGQTYREICDQIDGMVGNLKVEAPKPTMTPEKRRDVLRDTYRATQPIQPGDLAHKYLESRHVDELIYPAALRFAPKLRDGEGGLRPAMIAMVGVHGEAKPVSMHRTFLAADGSAKAEMGAPRKMMPGELPEGACVMLSEYTGGPLGIAEGIETAMSASALWSLPVWSAINANLLEKWTPPEGCTEVAIFGDNDPKFGGQAAAYSLAHKLAVKGIHVTIHIPQMVGTDWADVWAEKCKGQAQ
jgi:putative DNA primase/helicase